jgi:hypothetical protein
MIIKTQFSLSGTAHAQTPAKLFANDDGVVKESIDRALAAEVFY